VGPTDDVRFPLSQRRHVGTIVSLQRNGPWVEV
jgi:hypothetical protein